MIKTIQDKKFNNTIVTYVTTMKVMTKTITTIVTKMDKYKKCFEKRACRKLNSLIIKPWVFTYTKRSSDLTSKVIEHSKKLAFVLTFK